MTRLNKKSFAEKINKFYDIVWCKVEKRWNVVDFFGTIREEFANFQQALTFVNECKRDDIDYYRPPYVYVPEYAEVKTVYTWNGLSEP
jgi:hypothetical protein